MGRTGERANGRTRQANSATYTIGFGSFSPSPARLLVLFSLLLVLLATQSIILTLGTPKQPELERGMIKPCCYVLQSQYVQS